LGTGATLAAELRHPIASRQREALHRLVERITIRRDGLRIALKSDPLGCVVFFDKDDRQAESPTCVMIDVETRFVRKGQDLHLVVPPTDGADSSSRSEKSLVKAIARAVTWYDDLVAGRASSMREIATTEGVSERYVAQLLPLAFLKPELVEGCLDGAIDLPIRGSDLARGLPIPCEWRQQSTRFTGN
jgi:hypothetical protein